MRNPNVYPYVLIKDTLKPHLTVNRYTKECFTPRQLTCAYNAGKSMGDGIKIAVIAAFDNVQIENNMKVFCKEYRLDIPKMSLFYPDGKNESTSRSWSIESSLDTQWAHVFAPMAELCVVFAKNAETESLLSAARYASYVLECDVVSMSFGRDESANDEQISAFMKEAESIFVSSSGDVGGRVSFPSTSPYCISVGASKLTMYGDRKISETACANGGGGVSRVFEIPLWQGRFFDIYAMSQGFRAVPDVCMNGAKQPGTVIYDSANGGFISASGSSLSCACFAGVCACIKSENPNIKTSTQMLTYLYDKAGNVGYSKQQNSFYDITLGGCTNYKASYGWDFCTGLGSPKVSNLVKSE